MALTKKRSGKNVAERKKNVKMSRSQALKMIAVGAGAIGIAAVGMAGKASAIGGDEPWDNKVYPTGDAERDSRAIQEAVNRGGTVRLMSAKGQHFNLVDYTITITRSLSIIGQGTKIKYGNMPAFSCAQRGIMLSIRNIKFMDLGRVGVCAFDITKPARGSMQLDLSSIAIGGDEPWD